MSFSFELEFEFEFAFEVAFEVEFECYQLESSAMPHTATANPAIMPTQPGSIVTDVAVPDG